MQTSGSKKAAFFDVDGTIISMKSLISFAHFLGKKNQKPIHLSSMPAFLDNIHNKLRSNSPRRDINRHYFQILRGLSPATVSGIAKDWFAEEESKAGCYIENSVSELRRLKQQGFLIVLVTGSFLPLLEALSERLEIDDILCTFPECVDGKYTGELIGAPCIGETKRKRVLQYAIDRNIDLASSWAFGDDDSDIPLLSSVGHGVRISPITG